MSGTGLSLKHWLRLVKHIGGNQNIRGKGFNNWCKHGYLSAIGARSRAALPKVYAYGLKCFVKDLFWNL